jgi:hypothetical protein
MFKTMDWKQQAKIVFNVSKPTHFLDYSHCCECAEHDQTLSTADVDSIGLDQLGNAGWDPLCFCSPEGFLYYMPALIRLTLDTIDNPRHNYLEQMLFHLIRDGAGNMLVEACTSDQRAFVARFLEHLVESHAQQIQAGVYTADDVLRAHDIWSEG